MISVFITIVPSTISADLWNKLDKVIQDTIRKLFFPVKIVQSDVITKNEKGLKNLQPSTIEIIVPVFTDTSWMQDASFRSERDADFVFYIPVMLKGSEYIDMSTVFNKFITDMKKEHPRQNIDGFISKKPPLFKRDLEAVLLRSGIPHLVGCMFIMLLF